MYNKTCAYAQTKIHVIIDTNKSNLFNFFRLIIVFFIHCLCDYTCIIDSEACENMNNNNESMKNNNAKIIVPSVIMKHNSIQLSFNKN